MIKLNFGLTYGKYLFKIKLNAGLIAVPLKYYAYIRIRYSYKFEM